jgi:beta-lactamase superfamily II metal-dependent hydrolase
MEVIGMSIVKSFSVGNGDMFYIKHGSDNFSVIDCCYDSDDDWESQLDEIELQQKEKGIRRFISTHPDDDHIKGLKDFNSHFGYVNFYCVENEATKTDETDDFKEYKKLRDDDEKAFYLHKGCSRKWMNENSEERGSAGINCLWPIRSNQYFEDALEKAKNGENPNNISPIIKYSINDGASFLWLGDIETDFLEKVKDEISFSHVDIVFAPHHGRKSGRLPQSVLDKLTPHIVVVGEAPSSDLTYYSDCNTITQNTSGNIAFYCDGSKVKIYVESSTYYVKFLDDEQCQDTYGNYIGTLNL